MTVSIAPTEDQTMAALRTFLIGGNGFPGALPAGMEAVLGQVNRVPSPAGAYAVYWPMRRDRLATNFDATVDGKFVGSIAGSTMTITEVDAGVLKVGSMLFGIGMTTGTTITAFGTGSGGIGTYQVAPSQTFGPGVISAGVLNMTEQVEFTVQIDVHGDAAGDNAQRISTMMRDDFAVQAFAATGFDVTPLHADDPRRVPFINDQNQYEDRYVVEAVLQVNAAVLDIPQQFFDQAVVGLISVDERYPP